MPGAPDREAEQREDAERPRQTIRRRNGRSQRSANEEILGSTLVAVHPGFFVLAPCRFPIPGQHDDSEHREKNNSLLPSGHAWTRGAIGPSGAARLWIGQVK